jgi:hypothetical protein
MVHRDPGGFAGVRIFCWLVLFCMRVAFWGCPWCNVYSLPHLAFLKLGHKPYFLKKDCVEKIQLDSSDLKATWLTVGAGNSIK